jgi:fatty acid desaturase
MASSGSRAGTQGTEKEGVMLWTVAVVLLVLWALGMGTAYTGGGLVHVLLVIAAIVVVFQFLGGRRRTV